MEIAHTVRFTPERYAISMKKARALGFSCLAEYLRTLALGPIEASRRELKALIGEPGRSGGRLNETGTAAERRSEAQPDLQDQLRTTLRTHECTLSDALIALRALR